MMPKKESEKKQKVSPPDPVRGQALASESHLLGVKGSGPEVEGGPAVPLGKKDWATRPLEFSVGDVGGSAKK